MERRFFIFILLIFFGFCLPMSGAKASDYAAVVPNRSWSFPRDHGAHPEFKTEWWYFTGHLRDASGRTFGFQWTVFRSALIPPGNPLPADASAWRARQIYLGHVAVSDLREKHFRFAESASREALGLAGGSEAEFRVWLPGFAATPVSDGVRLQAARGEISLNLTTSLPDQVVLNGNSGYSPKSLDGNRASYYYSIPHLRVQGELSLDGKTIPVSGEAWMDHEFGSSELADTQSGWDWMGLPLDGTESLMVYRLRDRNDSRRDFLAGTYVDAKGVAHSLTAEELRISNEQTWSSPRSGGKYPLRWHVSAPSYGLELDVDAAFSDQELDTRKSTQVTYWEGSAVVQEKISTRPVTSRGYLEMTGYAPTHPSQ